MSLHNNTNQWIPRPLNRKDNLSGWKCHMAAKCPNPSIGQLVWLDKNTPITLRVKKQCL